MIIKKLAVPFINDKLLQQVEHCYIATAAISEAGFDFIRSRIPTKTKMEIVTGLDVPTDPEVLRKIWRHYQGRITLNIYTRNPFHANVYIFDLPFRKSMAFVGSGHFTLEGLKDSEELFYKIKDAKEIETLKSWFIGYYEFADPLNENLIQEYELVYPTFKERESKSRNEKNQLLTLTTGGFSWDHIKFKDQYFKKEDYLTLANNKARVTTPELLAGRMSLQTKLLQLHDQIKGHVHKLKIDYSDAMVSSLDPAQHTDRQLRSVWLAYGRSMGALKKYDATIHEVMHLQITINQKDVGVYLMAGTSGNGKADRSYFSSRMNDAEYRNHFFTRLKALGAGYWIEVACERKSVEFFQTEDALWEFTKADQWLYYKFLIGKNYSPDAVEISNEKIAPTLTMEFDKLVLLYREMIAPDPT
jgi:HKD family nuclease